MTNSDQENSNSAEKKREMVCVLGLGFVGAAMAVAVANAKEEDGQPLYDVIGIDLPNKAGREKVASINQGIFPFENADKKLTSVQSQVHQQGNLLATTDTQYLSEADIVVVDINLDMQYDDLGGPYLDLSAFKKAIIAIGEKIKEGALVVIETTVPPGTCEKIVLPVIEEEFARRGRSKESVLLAHSYERVMPGENYFDSIINYWRVYSGATEEAANRCEQFLSSIINIGKYPLKRLQKTTASETAKVLENSYRATTIAFMEEWGRFAEAVEIDLFEVINAIRMRPTHSNMRQPGFGVGGYCLTKDPYFAYLAGKDIFGLEHLDFPFSTQAVKINNRMPLVSLDKIEREFGSLVNKKILLMGISYRQDVGDTRYSPSEIFARVAIERGAQIVCHDPLIKYWREMKIKVLQELPDLQGVDVVVFAVQHDEYKMIKFSKWLQGVRIFIFDANDVLNSQQRKDIRNNDCKIGCIGRAE